MKKIQDDRLEEERKQLEEAQKQAELSKGDAAKVTDLINELKAIAAKYSFKSVKNQKMFVGVISLLQKVIDYIQK